MTNCVVYLGIILVFMFFNDVTTVWIQCFREDTKRERLDPI